MINLRNFNAKHLYLEKYVLKLTQLYLRIKRYFYKDSKQKGTMQFKVLGRDDIEIYKENRKHIVISIRDCKAMKAKLSYNTNRIATLYLEFADLDKGLEGYVLFNKNLAKEVLNFVELFKDKIELIICQCEAGISRSSAIAGALSKILNGDDTYFFKRYIPNRLVYRLILEEANKRELINKISQSEREIMKGKFKTQEEVFNKLGKFYEEEKS